jgi:hypothetical protein
MICDTIKKGHECPFMTAKGCTYNSGICLEVIESCKGCKRSAEFEAGWYCSACPDPNMKWKNGNCNLATHVSTAMSTAKGKINPLKASKRGAR